SMERTEGLAAAESFVDTHYPDCLAAVLFGSVARGEATPSSDLDILVVVRQEIEFCRKSFREQGWLIEAFVGSRKFNEEKIQRPPTNHNPSFLTSWAEGIILKDHDDFARSLKARAIEVLEQGPDPLTQREIDRYRSVMTNGLDDLMDSKSHEEALFIAHD